MPSAIDLIGHNPALQEHWIRRFLAFVIDAIIVFAIGFIFAIRFSILARAWYLIGLYWGLIWFAYSMFLETVFHATIGKRLVSLRVVAIDGNLDVLHALLRNLSKIFGIVFVLDILVGGVTQGDPRQRLFDRIARTTVTRVDQGAYMEEQFRMMQHAGPYPMTMPQAPPRTNPPPAPGSAQAAGGTGTQPSGGWPGAAPTPSTWPQHQWDAEGKLVKEMRYCTDSLSEDGVRVPATGRVVCGCDVRERRPEGDERDADEPRVQARGLGETDRALDEELGAHHGPQDAEHEPLEPRPDDDLASEDPARELEPDLHILHPRLNLLPRSRPLRNHEVQDVRHEEGDEGDALELRQVAVEQHRRRDDGHDREEHGVSEDDLLRGLNRTHEGARANHKRDRHDRRGERRAEREVRASLLHREPADQQLGQRGERRDKQRTDDEAAPPDLPGDPRRVVRDELRALVQEHEADRDGSQPEERGAEHPLSFPSDGPVRRFVDISKFAEERRSLTKRRRGVAAAEDQGTSSPSRPVSIARRISIAMRRPVLIGPRHSEVPYGWPTAMWTFVPPPIRRATS